MICILFTERVMNQGTPINLADGQRIELGYRVRSHAPDACSVRRARIVLQFLRQIGRETPKDKALHLVGDNYATHKHPTVQEWLEKHPRFHIHFMPTSASWLNMVERFFRSVSTDRLERGVFCSVPELISAIDEHIAVHNQNPKRCAWTAKGNDVFQEVIRANRNLGSKKNEALHYG